MDRTRAERLPGQGTGPARRGGEELFEALFHGDLLSCFRRSLEQAEREDAGLRIRLRLADAPELANLPWEYLYDRGADRFFALSTANPVVRYLERPEPLRPLAVRPISSALWPIPCRRVDL